MVYTPHWSVRLSLRRPKAARWMRGGRTATVEVDPIASPHIPRQMSRQRPEVAELGWFRQTLAELWRDLGGFRAQCRWFRLRWGGHVLKGSEDNSHRLPHVSATAASYLERFRYRKRTTKV